MRQWTRIVLSPMFLKDVNKILTLVSLREPLPFSRKVGEVSLKNEIQNNLRINYASQSLMNRLTDKRKTIRLHETNFKFLLI